MQTAATDGISGMVGAGHTALAQRWRTLPAVSAPSSVVRSSIETASLMPCCLAVVLIDRLPSWAARSSTPTRSTCASRRLMPRGYRACSLVSMSGMPRAAVIVMDACGVGALPDAAAYGDEGTNTLGHLSELAGGLDLPTMGSLGLGCVVPLRGVPPARDPVLHGR